MDRQEITEQINRLVPRGSGPLRLEDQRLPELKRLTQLLVNSAIAEGRITSDPFAPIYARSISLPKERLGKLLRNRIIMVTGGQGHVGQALITALNHYEPRRIICVDNLHDNGYPRPRPYPQLVHFHSYDIDIRDRRALDNVFREEAPDVVFHCAAQRLPAHAEDNPEYTVTTNILGTKNVVELCMSHEVERCVFSSTGKASRFMTRDVYAGSKKVCEWIIHEAAQTSDVAFAMARFTHVSQTSPVAYDFEIKHQTGIIGLHSHSDVMYSQSITEAVYLLLNALLLSRPKNARILAVANLGWPIEVLDLALFRIKASGAIVPLYFAGHPEGYSEPLFRGHLQYSGPSAGNPLFNVLELPLSNTGAGDDIIVSELAPFSHHVLGRHLNVLTQLSPGRLDPSVYKRLLGRAVRGIAQSAFHLVDPVILLRTLAKGLDPRVLETDSVSLSAHKDIVEIYLKALYGRLTPKAFASAAWTKPLHYRIAESLRHFVSVRDEAEYLINLMGPEPTRMDHEPNRSLDAT